MTGTKNLLILGIFCIFAIRLQAHPAVVRYEMPPPIQLPLYTTSRVAFSQYSDVPMLSIEEMKHVFPWLEYAKPASTETETAQSQREPQYIFHYSPNRVTSKSNDNLEYDAENFNVDSMRTDAPTVLGQTQRETNFNYNSADVNFTPTQSTASYQEQWSHVSRISEAENVHSESNNKEPNKVDELGDNISQQSDTFNIYDVMKPNSDFSDTLSDEDRTFVPSTFERSFDQDDVRNHDRFSDQVLQPSDAVRRRKNSHNEHGSPLNTGRREDILENHYVESVERFKEPSSHGQHRSEARRIPKGSKRKHTEREKCMRNMKCGEQNDKYDKFRVRESEHSKDRPTNQKTENEKLPSEQPDIPDEEFESEFDNSHIYGLHDVETKHRLTYVYPKELSPYMEPPKLTIGDQEFYSKLKPKSRGKKRKSEIPSTEDDGMDRLKNHRFNREQNDPENEDLELLGNLKNHKMEYIRDHAPQNDDEKTSESQDNKGKVHHPRKKPINPLELSPDGERIEFQIHGHEGPKTYIFGFDTGNGKNRHFRLEERLRDGTVKGHYGYYDATGKLKMVQYTAKPLGGYQEKHHESSDYKSETEHQL